MEKSQKSEEEYRNEVQEYFSRLEEWQKDYPALKRQPHSSAEHQIELARELYGKK